MFWIRIHWIRIRIQIQSFSWIRMRIKTMVLKKFCIKNRYVYVFLISTKDNQAQREASSSTENSSDMKFCTFFLFFKGLFWLAWIRFRIFKCPNPLTLLNAEPKQGCSESLLRIQDVYPGSEFFPSRISDPHQRNKFNFNPKTCF